MNIWMTSVGAGDWVQITLVSKLEIHLWMNYGDNFMLPTPVCADDSCRLN